MTKDAFLLLCVGAAVLAKATPVISNVEWSQDPNTHKVTITYDLTEGAIVTIDVCTNGTASIGGEHLTSLAGAANRFVAADEDHTVTWLVDRDWPGHHFASGELSIALKAWTKDVPPDYLVVDLRMTNTVTCPTIMYYADAAAIPEGVTNDVYKAKKLVMRRIPAAGVAWRMGSPAGETGRTATSGVEPEHYVRFDNDYYVGIYPVTMGQYYQLCGQTPAAAMSGFNMDAVTNANAHPVGGISYAYNANDASQSYLMRTDVWPGDRGWSLSNFKMGGFFVRLYGLSGIPFNLPTEAQWEFACRAGTGSAFNSGKGCTTAQNVACPNMDEVGWYSKNTATTQPVGLKQANGWGLYDMHGNVYEWCLDWYGTISGTASDPATEPGGAASNADKKRIRRGGGYSSSPKDCRSASRGNAAASGNYVNNGFRLCCPVPVNW